MASKKVCLIGPPGSGKTMMIARTAVRRPVHFIDIDRKIGSSNMFADLKDVTWVEIDEKVDEESLIDRMKQMTENKQLTKLPKGWQRIADEVHKLITTPEGKAAGTWAFDSMTLGSEHLKALICYYAKKNKYTFDQWTALLTGWRDTMSVIRDLAAEHDKDIMFTIHERTKEAVGDRVTGVSIITGVTSSGELTRSKDFKGTMDVKIVGSIDGQFGEQFGAYFDDVYALSVEMVNDKPKWVCRVKPDGKRDLRCSFPVDKDEYEPDFKQIWKSNK